LNKKRLKAVFIILLGITAAVIIPMLRVCRTPNWGDDAHLFLYKVDKSLRRFLLANGNEMPSELALLYPKYIDDKRVLEQVSLFAGRKMAIIYWYPQSLTNVGDPVVQLMLDPSVKTNCHWRSFALWGDGKVRCE
jgi:hypothetical protein